MIALQFRSAKQAHFHDRLAQHLRAPIAPLLLEGATGLGKTRAYLQAVMDAVARGQRIAIALPSHQLIDQLLASADLQAVQRPGVRVVAFRPKRWFAVDDPFAYAAARQAALDAEVMLCTSAAVIIDHRLGGSYNGATLRDHLLFDEADQLPGAAALQSDAQIDAATVQALGLNAPTAAQVLAAVLTRKGLEPELRAAALLMQDALDEPVWYQRVGLTGDGGVALVHHLPGRLLKAVANRPAVSFVSATLTIGGQFEDFKRSLGIAEISPLSAVIEPEQHGQLQFEVADLAVDSEAWWTRTVQTVRDAALLGPVLVVTPSHALAQRLGEALPFATVRQSDETAGQAASRMAVNSGAAVLIAAGAWAGLDTPLRWRSIVIPRIPYEAPVVLDGKTESRFLDTRNTAVRRMRQVIGRGLRTPDAQCTIHILDGRFVHIAAFVPRRFATAWQGRKTFAEGRAMEVTLTRYERDPSVRKKALAHHGKACMACGFKPKVDSQLDVHHLQPVSEGERLTSLDDVAVLCANCHRLAHSEDPPLPLVTLRALVL
jgi:Rad3-related DNA helicase